MVTGKFEEDFTVGPRDPSPRCRRHPDQEVRRRVLVTPPRPLVGCDHPEPAIGAAAVPRDHDERAPALAHGHPRALALTDHRHRALRAPPRDPPPARCAPSARSTTRSSTSGCRGGVSASRSRSRSSRSTSATRGVPADLRPRELRQCVVHLPVDARSCSTGPPSRFSQGRSPPLSAIRVPGSRASRSCSPAPMTPTRARSPSTASTCAT